MSNRFYITTAIDYANGKPHLGHAYEKVLADTIARHRRLSGDTVFFLTGLDEHGQKVQMKAKERGIAPKTLVDEVAVDFQNLCVRLTLSNNDYIRTTEPRHTFIVREMLQFLHDKGDIYQASYQGFYSPRQEQFLQERDRVNGKWPEIFGEVIEITENNYFFRIAKYQSWLVEWLNQHPDWIIPNWRQSQVLEFLKEPLNDLCISRPKTRLEWGIPLPFDEDYVTYVWFDALVNYISAAGTGPREAGDFWPAALHVIGKDILVPPHAVYWPIMLKAAGLELPQHLLVHGWWHISGEKMSKSLGNAVDPVQLCERFGTDAVRYFFMREMAVGQDSDFTEAQFLLRYTADLGNDLGNSVARLLNMGERYSGGKVPAPLLDEAPEQSLRAQWEESRRSVLESFDSHQFSKGLDQLWVFLRALNRYLDVRAPWKMAKSADAHEQKIVPTALAHLAESLRLAATLLLPVMPTIAARILERMSSPVPSLYKDELAWDFGRLQGKALGEKVILFPRIET